METAHLEQAPAGFADTADVVFEVDNQRLPAHSQFLAFHSRFIHSMLEDISQSGAQQKHSWLNPLMIPAALLSSCTVQDVHAFLCQIYDFSKPLQSAEQAYQLLKIGDRFDAPRIMKKCTDDVTTRAPRLFQSASPSQSSKQEPGAVEWALRAEQYGLKNLQKKALQYIALNYEALRTDERLKQLPADVLLQLADELHDVHLARTTSLLKKAKTTHEGQYGYSPWS